MVRVARPDTDRSGQLKIELGTPGMTALHKVGLAGLWMTLDYFDRARVQLPGSWECHPYGVVLRWGPEGPEPFFKALVRESFRIDRHGLIWLAALGPPEDHLAGAITLHEALLSTFLQHGRSRGADPASQPGGSVADTSHEEPQPLPPFQRVFWYKHQQAADDLLGSEGRLLPRPVAGWLYPGGVVRHVAYERQSALVEPPERWLSLLFAPVGAIFFRIQYRGEGVRPQFALVLPEIADLAAYAQLRLDLMELKMPLLTVSGTSEAGWRLLAQAQLRGYLSAIDVRACRVMAFGSVPWSSQQKTRVEVFPIPYATEDALSVYQTASRCLGPRWVQSPREGENIPYLYVSPALDCVARNLTEGQPWYAGFSHLMAEPGSRKALLIHDRRGLYSMIRETLTEQQPERIFVATCHEAWRRNLGRLGERAQREGLDFASLAAREQERIRSSLVRCKNAESLREVVVDFWSRSGPLPTLQEHWAEMLSFFTPKRWQLARDLALLALASYKGDEKIQVPAGATEAGGDAPEIAADTNAGSNAPTDQP